MSRIGFFRLYIPLAFPILDNAGLLQFFKKGSYSNLVEVDDIEPGTRCIMTKKAAKNMKQIRKGKRVRSGTKEQKQIFNNIFEIINGHLDEKHVDDAFTQHMNKGMYKPKTKLG